MLTKGQREILSVVIALCNQREVAVTLGMGYVRLNRQIEEICRRLELPCRYVRFGDLKLGGHFIYKGTRYQRVDKATDRFGGYNAQDGAGGRILVLYHEVVERDE